MDGRTHDAAIPEVRTICNGKLRHALLERLELSVCLSMVRDRIRECLNETQGSVEPQKFPAGSDFNAFQRAQHRQLLSGRYAVIAISNFEQSIDALPACLSGFHGK